jgi:heme/copper-type cytochrome/quinol oxidase subunit 2
MSVSGSPAEHALALWPAAASHAATHVDYLISAFTVLTLVLTVPIFIAITYFAIVYRASRKVDRGHPADRNVKLELSWMLIPFFLTLTFFAWGAQIFDVAKHPPANALRIEAIGRQWMWKFQHPGGQAEINDLHVPVGQPVLINMISQDVIHSLYLPTFRVQMETLPGRYTQLWFTADLPGVRHLQQVLHDARRDHGVLLPDPVDPGGARQLPDPAHDRREGPGLPALNLLSWYIYMTSAASHALRADRGGVDTGWTFYTPYSTTFSNTNVIRRRSASSSSASRRS